MRLQPDTSPQTLRIPDHSGHPLLQRANPLADEALPRLWIQRPSSERRRDFRVGLLWHALDAAHEGCPDVPLGSK